MNGRPLDQVSVGIPRDPGRPVKIRVGKGVGR